MPPLIIPSLGAAIALVLFASARLLRKRRDEADGLLRGFETFTGIVLMLVAAMLLVALHAAATAGH
ncbi:hypothetical protein CF15_07610 [Pyrodictium occultum]|uniref:Uncharacterized protein n=1 Tax=Pyrodictium occultum TaxID=2309 RepID=A0A0V8RWY0_PYROC|nr:hypothetical protein [Pyrodictium occultum]KSW12572.1 hypothetical protein CF15_07610 [Pyrodictium occultum]